MADPLQLRKAKPDAGVVEAIRKTLAEAESGELLEVVIVSRMTGGEVLRCHAGERHPFTMLGALDWMMHVIRGEVVAKDVP